MKGSLCRCTGYRAVEDAIRGVSHVEDSAAGIAFGRSVPAPAGPPVVTGTARYTLDVSMPALHLKLLRSPHAHARIKSIDKNAALAVSGVERGFSHGKTRRQSSIQALGMRTKATIRTTLRYWIALSASSASAWRRWWAKAKAPPRQVAAP